MTFSTFPTLFLLPLAVIRKKTVTAAAIVDYVLSIREVSETFVDEKERDIENSNKHIHDNDVKKNN